MEIELKGIIEEPRVKSLANGYRRLSVLISPAYWEAYQRLVPHTGQPAVFIVIPGQLEEEVDAEEHRPSLDVPLASPNGHVEDEPPTMTLEEYAEVKRAAEESDREALATTT